jgi:restriction system protein
MSIANGTLSIKCDNCQKQADFPAVDSDFDCIGGDERQMGSENLYEWEFEYECDECGQNIDVAYTATEYPEGMPNFEEVKVNGGQVVNKYHFNYSDGPEPDEDGNS